MNQGTRWVLLMQKNRHRKSHAWAPLSGQCNKIFLSQVFHQTASPGPNRKVFDTFQIFVKFFILAVDFPVYLFTTGALNKIGSYNKKRVVPHAPGKQDFPVFSSPGSRSRHRGVLYTFLRACPNLDRNSRSYIKCTVGYLFN
jgi:hypothetical protein